MTPFHPAGRTHDEISRESIRRFANAMHEPFYLLSLRDDAADRTVQVYWPLDRIESSLGWLRYRNAQGARIHGRPWSTRHCLIDDMTHSALDRLTATYTPVAVVQTSPGSLQVWLTISDGHVPPQLATCIAQLLARRFSGDEGAAAARQPGAWPSFTNVKHRHRQDDGRFPFTRLIYAGGPIVTPHAADLIAEAASALDHRTKARHHLEPILQGSGRICETTPCEEINEATRRIREDLGPGIPIDRSRRDFAVAKRLIERGASPAYIAGVLTASEKAISMPAAMADAYVRRTISAAHKHRRWNGRNPPSDLDSQQAAR